MPAAAEAVEDGLRYERSGLLDRAFEQYQLAAGGADPDAAAHALWRQASVHRSRCEWDEALAAARRSAAVATAADLPERLAEALNAEALVHQSRGDFATAAPLLCRVLELPTTLRVRGVALQNLGSLAAECGDLEDAERRFLDSYRCFHQAGYRCGEAIALNNYGRAALDRGDPELAARILSQTVETAKELEELELLALASFNLAEAKTQLGRLEEAEELVSTALGHFGNIGNRWRAVECLRLLGDIHRRTASLEIARECYERGLHIAKEIGARSEIPRLRERLADLGTTQDGASLEQ